MTIWGGSRGTLFFDTVKKRRKEDRPLFSGTVPLSPYIEQEEGLSLLLKKGACPLFSFLEKYLRFEVLNGKIRTALILGSIL
jgi:hypothetical protein